MDKNFVLNGNKLIAEFIDWKWDIEIKSELCVFDNSFETIINKAKYHKSWDWLMPVLNKIGIITNDNYYEKQHLFQDYYLPELDIKEVYSNVIEFIEWYNENK